MRTRKSRTSRGFAIRTFKDHYGNECSIQKSSLATDDAVWIGINDAQPKILARHANMHGLKTDQTTGWIPFPLSDDVSLTTRMHLTRDQVKSLIPILQGFVDTGEVS